MVWKMKAGNVFIIALLLIVIIVLMVVVIVTIEVVKKELKLEPMSSYLKRTQSNWIKHLQRLRRKDAISSVGLQFCRAPYEVMTWKS